MQLSSWFLWAFVLFFQNFSFTFVSRARNSGSLSRHIKAALFSNGIWIFSNMIMLGPLFNYLTGKHGIALQLAAGIVYTLATVSGSLGAHFWALKTEKGAGAVGANKKYAQIPTAEWESFKTTFAELKETAERAERKAADAILMSSSGLPVSPIVARKVGDEIVTTGIPK